MAMRVSSSVVEVESDGEKEHIRRIWSLRRNMYMLSSREDVSRVERVCVKAREEEAR